MIVRYYISSQKKAWECLQVVKEIKYKKKRSNTFFMIIINILTVMCYFFSLKFLFKSNWKKKHEKL
jgi:hypothetical protein